MMDIDLFHAGAAIALMFCGVVILWLSLRGLK
jgi:hypothetical protein